MTTCSRTFKLTAALPVFAPMPEALCGADHGSTLQLRTLCSYPDMSSLTTLPPSPLTEIAEDSGPLSRLRFTSDVTVRFSGWRAYLRGVPELAPAL